MLLFCPQVPEKELIDDILKDVRTRLETGELSYSQYICCNLDLYRTHIAQGQLDQTNNEIGVFIGLCFTFYQDYCQFTTTELSMIYSSVPGLKTSDGLILILDTCRFRF